MKHIIENEEAVKDYFIESYCDEEWCVEIDETKTYNELFLVQNSTNNCTLLKVELQGYEGLKFVNISPKYKEININILEGYTIEKYNYKLLLGYFEDEFTKQNHYVLFNKDFILRSPVQFSHFNHRSNHIGDKLFIFSFCNYMFDKEKYSEDFIRKFISQNIIYGQLLFKFMLQLFKNLDRKWLNVSEYVFNEELHNMISNIYETDYEKFIDDFDIKFEDLKSSITYGPFEFDAKDFFIK